MDQDEDILMEARMTPEIDALLGTLIPVRRDLYLDPMVADAWSCDPRRCRNFLGKNLCCKVEIRCRHMEGDRCGIHHMKPFSCALFPLDLIRVKGIRIVSTVKNMQFFNTGISRFDRDMIRCFEGDETGDKSMFEVQKSELLRAFTNSEVELMERKLAAFTSRT